MAFIPKDYVGVHTRIAKFHADNVHGRIITELLYNDVERVIFRASVYRDTSAEDINVGGQATGTAECPRLEPQFKKDRYGQKELILDEEGNPVLGPVDKCVEKCETIAVGRALANLGYEVKGGVASKEEMESLISSEVKENRELNLELNRLVNEWATEQDQQFEGIKEAIQAYFDAKDLPVPKGNLPLADKRELVASLKSAQVVA